MSDISELERRITAALDRAGQAMDRLGVGGGGEDAAKAAALAEELEAERVANAQLEERVRAIKEKQETTVAGLEAQVARLKEQLASRDGELTRLKAVGDDLRKSNSALREANASALPDGDLVNASLKSALDAEKAARAADRAEIEDILASLEPVLKEA